MLAGEGWNGFFREITVIPFGIQVGIGDPIVSVFNGFVELKNDG